MLKKVIILIITVAISLITVACTNTTNNTEDEASIGNETNKKQIEGWKESPIFTVGNYTMIGEEGRLGFIYDTEVTKLHPNQENKYMWHFWGNDSEFSGELKVIATHEKSGEEITVLQGRPLGGANNGADQHVPSNMSLPKSGMWKLDAYIGDKLFGTIFVKVYE